eukprot:3937272-Rhodomonas_salina.1
MPGISAVDADLRNSPKVFIADIKCTDGICLDCEVDDCGLVDKDGSESSDSGSDSTALIAGVVGGVGGVGLVGGTAWLYMQSRNKREEGDIETIQAVNVNDLKSQLQADV